MLHRRRIIINLPLSHVFNIRLLPLPYRRSLKVEGGKLTGGRVLLHHETFSRKSSSLKWLSLHILLVHVGNLTNADSFACHLREHTFPTRAVPEDKDPSAYTTAIGAV